jgi:putative oxidoreductase
MKEVAMFRKIIETDNDSAALVLRLMLAVVFFPHGAQKVFGWFGGAGFSGTMDAFTVKMGIPGVFAFLAILAESAGPLGLFLGLLTRIAAFGIFCNMAVAIFLVHLPHGFFMNWFGKQQGEGFEYHLLAIAITIALMLRGGGRWSVDGLIARK